MLFDAVGEICGNVILHPVPHERIRLRRIEEYPRTILTDNLLRLLPVHSIIRLVKLRIYVVGMVCTGRNVLRMKQLKEVLGIRVVPDPSKVEHLCASLINSRQKGIPCHVASRKLNSHAIVERRHQFHHLTRVLRRASYGDLKVQTASRLRIGSTRIAGFCKHSPTPGTVASSARTKMLSCVICAATTTA